MITEDYVSEKTSELLKEKGFNEECWCLYHLVTHKFAREVNFDLRHNNELPNYIASAPTLQMAMKWLREAHKISVIPRYDEVEDEKEHLHYVWFFYILSMNPYKTLIAPVQGYSTYEEACEEAIKYCLENLI